MAWPVYIADVAKAGKAGDTRAGPRACGGQRVVWLLGVKCNG